MNKEVIITREQANAAKRRGQNYWECLIERFQNDHGLKFKQEDFNDKSRFSFHEGMNADVFKVIYHGK